MYRWPRCRKHARILGELRIPSVRHRWPRDSGQIRQAPSEQMMASALFGSPRNRAGPRRALPPLLQNVRREGRAESVSQQRGRFDLRCGCRPSTGRHHRRRCADGHAVRPMTPACEREAQWGDDMSAFGVRRLAAALRRGLVAGEYDRARYTPRCARSRHRRGRVIGARSRTISPHAESATCWSSIADRISASAARRAPQAAFAAVQHGAEHPAVDDVAREAAAIPG